jgi:DNA-binding MarR family transcriptional regulator
MATNPFELEPDHTRTKVVTGLQRIGAVLRSQAWQDAGSKGLTPTQGQILAVLKSRSTPMRLTAVADELGVRAATASEAVGALVQKGLVKKVRDAHDGRALCLTLSAAGRRRAEEAASWPEFLLSAVDALSGDEQRVLVQALTKMIRTLQVDGRIPVARMCVTCKFFRPNQYEGDFRHHCDLVNAPFGDRHLRLDCPEHEPAADAAQERNWASYVGKTGDPG